MNYIQRTISSRENTFGKSCNLWTDCKTYWKGQEFQTGRQDS